jgi:hypothetical protein
MPAGGSLERKRSCRMAHAISKSKKEENIYEMAIMKENEHQYAASANIERRKPHHGVLAAGVKI